MNKIMNYVFDDAPIWVTATIIFLAMVLGAVLVAYLFSLLTPAQIVFFLLAVLGLLVSCMAAKGIRHERKTKYRLK